MSYVVVDNTGKPMIDDAVDNYGEACALARELAIEHGKSFRILKIGGRPVKRNKRTKGTTKVMLISPLTGDALKGLYEVGAEAARAANAYRAKYGKAPLVKFVKTS